MNTLTRASLAEAIYSQVGLSRNESAALLEAVLRTHGRGARGRGGGEDLRLRHLHGAAEGPAGRPQSRRPAIEVPILPRKVLSFRPSQVLKARINGQASRAGMTRHEPDREPECR